jgi:hypothetical protein
MNAIGAHQGAFDLTVKVAFNPLQVRTPCAFGFVVGVADTVSDGAALTA